MVRPARRPAAEKAAVLSRSFLFLTSWSRARKSGCLTAAFSVVDRLSTSGAFVRLRWAVDGPFRWVPARPVLQDVRRAQGCVPYASQQGLRDRSITQSSICTIAVKRCSHRSMLTRARTTTDIVAQDEETLATYAFLLGDYGVEHWCAAVDPTRALSLALVLTSCCCVFLTTIVYIFHV